MTAGTERTVDEPTLAPGVRALMFVLGGTSVASLLAWVLGIASFDRVFLFVSLPGQVALIVLVTVLGRRSNGARTLLISGVLGGLLGTLAYDVVRLPFVVAGHRLLAPIDSYGVLAAGATTSSPWTGILGWSFHIANGIGFGLAYAVIAERRSWRWGVAWGLLLETGTIITPFATLYALLGAPTGPNWFALSIAYAAHVPYGLALGLVVQHRERIVGSFAPPTSRAVPVTLGLVLLALVQWQAPWQGRPVTADAAPGPTVAVIGGEFRPEWLHVPVDGCATFDNADERTWTIEVAGRPVLLGRQASTRVCFPVAGVHRTRTSEAPYSGGFVIVDPEWSLNR